MQHSGKYIAIGTAIATLKSTHDTAVMRLRLTLGENPRNLIKNQTITAEDEMHEINDKKFSINILIPSAS